MPDLTNITDFDPATGKTTTTLVSDHDRGALEHAQRVGAGASNQPATKEKTVDEVLAAVDGGTITAQAAMDAERTGKNRSTLIAQLESRGAE